MFFFYVLSFVKKGDTIQEGTLFKGGHYLRKYGIYFEIENFKGNNNLVETIIFLHSYHNKVGGESKA